MDLFTSRLLKQNILKIKDKIIKIQDLEKIEISVLFDIVEEKKEYYILIQYSYFYQDNGLEIKIKNTKDYDFYLHNMTLIENAKYKLGFL